MPKPTFSPMTLDQALYDAVCDRISQEFADSYLTGAVMVARKLTPRTLTAYDKMRDSMAFRKFLEEAGIELIRPLPITRQATPITHDMIRRMVH